MKLNAKIMTAAAVGILGVAGLSGSAHAAATEVCNFVAAPGAGNHYEPTNCVRLNMGGSSAGTGYATQVPLNLLDQDNPGTPDDETPIHYVNGVIGSITSGKLHVWTGLRAGVPTIIRYSATGSSDGIKRLQQPAANALSNMNHLDHTVTTGCSAATLQTRAADGKTYYERTGCTGGTFAIPSTLGASDVHGNSFHQTGPSIPLTKVTPLDQSMLTSVQAAIVPFKFVLGNAVKRVNPATGDVLGVNDLLNVESLSQDEIQALLARKAGALDWKSFGLVGDLNGDGDADATAPVTLCLRSAGSGTKATLDETVMLAADETTSGSTNLTNPASGVYFGTSTQDVRDCIGGNAGAGRPAHPLAIGYVDADATVPNGYDVKMDGRHANDLILADPKSNIKCGKYKYWVGWRLNYRNYVDPDILADQQALIVDFVNDAALPTTTDLLAAGAYWVSPGDMYVSKNADAGPVLWNNAANPCGE